MHSIIGGCIVTCSVIEELKSCIVNETDDLVAFFHEFSSFDLILFLTVEETCSTELWMVLSIDLFIVFVVAMSRACLRLLAP